jgi:hypothetical protein
MAVYTLCTISGKIYASSVFNGEVGIFSGDIVVPTVTTSEASEFTQTGVTLHGHVDPDAAHGGGEVTECVFEYGTTTFTAGRRRAHRPPPTPPRKM